MEVGIRELRSELRHWLDEVKAGREVVVTERGQAVARIVPANGPSALEGLIEAGVITKPRAPVRAASAHKRVAAKGRVSELVKDQRR